MSLARVSGLICRKQPDYSNKQLTSTSGCEGITTDPEETAILKGRPSATRREDQPSRATRFRRHTAMPTVSRREEKFATCL